MAESQKIMLKAKLAE